MARIDWRKAESFYITATSKPTLNEIAAKFSVSRPSVARHSGMEDWVEKRDRFRAEAAERTQEQLLEQAVTDNLTGLGVMEGQLESLTEINDRLLKEFRMRIAVDGRLEAITDKDLLDSVAKMAKAKENSARAISFLKGGADSRTAHTFAELAARSSKKEPPA